MSDPLVIDRVPADRFRDAVRVARKSLKEQLGLNLTVHPLAAYEEMDCYLLTKRDGGFAVSKSGELVNLWSYQKGRGDALVDAAIERGASHLDCYDGYLPQLYSRHGFVEVERIPWDDAYAPEGWTYGTPDVVYMRRGVRVTGSKETA